jgi:hypothetical protein
MYYKGSAQTKQTNALRTSRGDSVVTSQLGWRLSFLSHTEHIYTVRYRMRDTVCWTLR